MSIPICPEGLRDCAVIIAIFENKEILPLKKKKDEIELLNVLIVVAYAYVGKEL